MAIISISDSQVNGADQILVADSSSKIPAKDGSQITILNATNVATGTIASARLDTGTTANKLVILDGSGNLPAIDASLLTGIVSATISASDPTISTNPSGGVGTEWNNSTSGDMFICTNATAGSNVWKNVGVGTGDIKPFDPTGSSYGYHMHSVGPWGTFFRNIDKYSYTSDSNATNVGDQLAFTGGFTHAGTQGTTHGYLMGGANYPPTTNLNRIERVSFSTDGNAVDVGDLLSAKHGLTGHTNNAKSYGYCTGGSTGTHVNTIEKFLMTSSANATDVGDLLHIGYHSGGADGNNYGYVFGAHSSSTNAQKIQKFSYTSDSDSTFVSNMLSGTSSGACRCSNNGEKVLIYGANNATDIDVFYFASEANAVDFGQDRFHNFSDGGASSSSTHAYMSGGNYVNTIAKISWAGSAVATDVADLTHPSGDRPGGFQY
jgi:hypothetical protein